MKKKLILIMLHSLFAATLFAQQNAERATIDRITDSIQTEGKALYRSEWASWYGTDVFTEKCPVKKVRSGGYLSYETNQHLVNIFFSQGDSPKVLATISFGKDFDVNNYKLDTVERSFNAIEQQYYIIRMAGLKRAISDTAFKHYNNTGLNVVPLIQNDFKRVYVLTSPTSNKVVIFGNDYLINFNKANEITGIKTLHKNIIPINSMASDGTQMVAGMHTHSPETGDFMTATDICTLMLYEHFTTWNIHYVMSKNYVSVWDCKKNKLAILTAAAWEKLSATERVGVIKD